MPCLIWPKPWPCEYWIGNDTAIALPVALAYKQGSAESFFLPVRMLHASGRRMYFPLKNNGVCTPVQRPQMESSWQ